MPVKSLGFIPNSPLQVYEEAIDSVKELINKNGLYYKEERSRYNYYQSSRSDVEKVILPINLGKHVYRRTFDVGKDRLFRDHYLRLSRIKVESKIFNSDEMHENLVFYFFSKEGSFVYGTLFDTFDSSKILSVGKGIVFSKRSFRSNVRDYRLAEIKDAKKYSLEDLSLHDKSRIPSDMKKVGRFMLGLNDFNDFL
ncbi:MAG: hypothetical protein PF542_00845 [Nanoarchaeota archaeon]|jgi:hypothetical protein|nr:hypothetical protein [Nanoarchaeota archaeon]